MGSSCCRPKDKSPKVSLRKIFSRWSHRISPKSDTCKIADAEKDGNLFKRKDSIVVTDPEFETPESEERNHVVMHTTDAPPRIQPKKKTRMHNKRVSFQSDVEIMRTASSKSLDRFTVTIVQEEPKPRSKSFESFFDLTTLAPPHDALKKRRTSSLECLNIEEIPGITLSCITAKLRRDTLGDALDLQAYKRPMTLPTPEEPVIEEEEDDEIETDEEQLTSFKLAAKLRRDTLGDALLLTSRYHDDTPTGSSTEDLEETVKHSKLCSKLRRDTFGDALRQAVHCKACSSMEDITDLENTPDEEKEEIKIKVEQVKTVSILSDSTSKTKEHKTTYFKSETKCKTCKSLEVDNQNQCIKCSSSENIPNLPNGLDSQNECSKNSDMNVPSPSTPVKQLLLTDVEITETLEKIRTTGKIEPKEPYNLVYSSSMAGPFASSKENLNETEKTSSNDCLSNSHKNDSINLPDKNQNNVLK